MIEITGSPSGTLAKGDAHEGSEKKGLAIIDLVTRKVSPLG